MNPQNILFRAYSRVNQLIFLNDILIYQLLLGQNILIDRETMMLGQSIQILIREINWNVGQGSQLIVSAPCTGTEW